MTAYISEERKGRINRFIRDNDKIRSLAAELLFKYMIRTIYGVDRVSQRFVAEKRGNPYLIGSGLKFNISHLGDYVACAIGDSEVGIDVEKIGKAELLEAYGVFAPSEIGMINDLPHDEQADMFYRIWILKESFVKKTGDGLYRSFDSFSFNLSDERICLKEDNKADCEVAFFNKKLNSRYWYSVCYPSCEVLNGIVEYDIFRIIDNVRG